MLVELPNGKTKDVHAVVAAGLASGERAWYRCAVCDGIDSECEYCGGSGYEDFTATEASYPWIADAIAHPRRVRRRALIKIVRRAIARKIRRVANAIHGDDL